MEGGSIRIMVCLHKFFAVEYINRLKSLRRYKNGHAKDKRPNEKPLSAMKVFAVRTSLGSAKEKGSWWFFVQSVSDAWHDGVQHHSTWEAEADLKVQGQPGLNTETCFNRKIRRRRKRERSFCAFQRIRFWCTMLIKVYHKQSYISIYQMC